MFVLLLIDFFLFWFVLICFWTFYFLSSRSWMFFLCCSHFAYSFFLKTLFGIVFLFFIFYCCILSLFHKKPCCFWMVSVCTVSFFGKTCVSCLLVLMKEEMFLCVFSFFLFFTSQKKSCKILPLFNLFFFELFTLFGKICRKNIMFYVFRSLFLFSFPFICFFFMFCFWFFLISFATCFLLKMSSLPLYFLFFVHHLSICSLFFVSSCFLVSSTLSPFLNFFLVFFFTISMFLCVKLFVEKLSFQTSAKLFSVFFSLEKKLRFLCFLFLLVFSYFNLFLHVLFFPVLKNGFSFLLLALFWFFFSTLLLFFLRFLMYLKK